MKRHYFAGFRKELRDRLATLIGVEAEAVKYEEVKSKLDHHVYVRSLYDLKWNPIELLESLKKCAENGTKFVSIDDGFCFDGSAKKKILRLKSLMSCKYPEIGQTVLSMLQGMETAKWNSAVEEKRNKKILTVLTDYIGTTVVITPELIARLLDLQLDGVKQFVNDRQAALEDRERRKEERRTGIPSIHKPLHTNELWHNIPKSKKKSTGAKSRKPE